MNVVTADLSSRILATGAEPILKAIVKLRTGRAITTGTKPIKSLEDELKSDEDLLNVVNGAGGVVGIHRATFAGNLKVTEVAQAVGVIAKCPEAVIADFKQIVEKTGKVPPDLLKSLVQAEKSPEESIPAVTRVIESWPKIR
jgi:hypothetical protein